ncbi:MAG: hypothetical protein Q9191_002581 [Dirinaria sp. TL-2023a]
MEHLSSLSNPLANVEQLSNSSSQLDGLSTDLEASVRLAGAQLTQAAGILLRLPQEVIAQAIVIFTRFYTGPEGGSFLFNAAKDVSAASLYMIAKSSALPQSPRSVLNVYAFLLSQGNLGHRLESSQPTLARTSPETYYLSEGNYMLARTTLYQTEALVLRVLSFNTKVVVPHHLALTFLQTLGVLPTPATAKSKALAARVIAHLNSALFSPQLLYLTHQPTSLAVAAIYLAAREVGLKLPTSEWWEVFDVDREELGFLVLGLGSCAGWIENEKDKWASSACPLSKEELEVVMKQSNGT